MTFPVSMTGISKRFGSVQALRNVDLHVEQGSLHALVGENGAGKTTLMRILYGAVQADTGSISLDGQEARFSSSSRAISQGIGMVSQHYAIIPQLTCLQNLMLGAEGAAILNLKSATTRAQELADRMGFQFDWHRPAAGLSPAAAQKLEILKLLWRDSRVMILDEPTAMLSPADSEALFSRLKRLASEGATVILVTHRLPDVIANCSTVTVLRAGERVAEKSVRDTNSNELAQLIVGGAIAQPPARCGIAGDEVLRVRDLKLRGDRGQTALKDVSFDLRSGEIVGIAGVDGSGQRELFQALSGIAAPSSGTILLNGQDLTQRSTSDRISQGLRLIPEDRQEEGLIDDWSLEENAALGLQRLHPFAKGRLVNIEARRNAAKAISEMFSTKHGGLRLPVRSLSGGNQQRFISARALFLEPKLILAFQPARGLDFNGATRVYAGIREACLRGACALVVSFDLDELLEYCDRVLVMNRGELLAPPPNQALDRDTIGRLMVMGEP